MVDLYSMNLLVIINDVMVATFNICVDLVVNYIMDVMLSYMVDTNRANPVSVLLVLLSSL